MSDIDECYTSSKPADIARELAAMKAQAVVDKQQNLGGTVVIGADTIVVLDGCIFSKPGDATEAFDMLKQLQDRSHEVITGVALIATDIQGKQIVSTFAEHTTVHVGKMTDAEIETYIATGEPFDKAGGYGIQGPFARHVTGIEGDYFNVVGLPVSALYQRIKLLV